MLAVGEKVHLERILSQDDFDRFAALSGDDNPIHVDPEFSARTRFGRTVAHGVLLCTIVRGLIEKLLPGARQLKQQVKFPAPTYADEPLRFEAEIIASNEQQAQVRFQVTRCADGQQTCVGDTWLLAHGAGQ